ncbi:hypothetical protein [Glycomyces buryatensis]|nr:hypothetical protein [Glycomyces buryatensis]
MREFWAELVGTFCLVFFAVGSAVYGIETEFEPELATESAAA